MTLPPTLIQRERDSGFELIRPPTLDRPEAEFSGFAQGDGLVTPPGFVSMIETLLPNAPCGRSSLQYQRQASKFSLRGPSVPPHPQG